MKKISKMMLLMVMCIIGGVVFTGCANKESAAANKEKEYTDKAMTQAFDAVGLPSITNYFERSQLKSIYELRDDPNLVCYWYTKNQYTGKWVFEGKCLGYGIPYGASMTSHDGASTYHVGHSEGYDSVILPQSEPNGIYTNAITSSATWILSIDAQGNVKPNYVKQEISVRQKDDKIPANHCEDWSIPEDY